MHSYSKSLIDYVGSYVFKRKFSVIPLKLGEKTPVIDWKEYQERCASAEEVLEWFGSWESNLGIVTGKISGIVVIDYDSVEAYEKAKGNGLLETPTVKTANGYHCYFKYRPGLKNVQNREEGYDVRSDGGYVVAPPSVHPSGAVYEWVKGMGLNDIPFAELPIDKFHNAMKERTYNKHEQVAEIVKGVSQGARNTTLARLTGILSKHNCGLEESIEYARYWNTNNTPPLDDEEVVRTVKSIYSTHERNAVITTGSMKPQKLLELFQEVDKEVNWLLDGILPMNGISVLASKPKVGKSTLARNLALSVANGKPFLGRKVTQGPVIYYALEDKKEEVKKHFREMGATDTDAENIYVYAGGATPEAIKEVEKAFNDISPVLMIIDPLFRFTKKVSDANDYMQVTNAFEPILRFAREADVHIACIHHTNKKVKQDADSLLGSTGILASVDTSLIIQRHEEYRTISSIQRYGEDLAESTLIFNKTGRTVELGKSREEQENDRVSNEIYELLKAQTAPINEEEIVKQVTGITGLKRKALRNLYKEGKIIREGKGAKGDPFLYSCLLVPPYIVEQENKNIFEELEENFEVEEELICETLMD